MAVENLTLAPFYGNNRNPFNYAKMEQIGRDTTTQWLTTDQITNQLNLFDDDSQDAYVVGLELAVRMAIEDYLGMAIFATQWKIYYMNFGLYNTQVYLDLPEVSTQYQTQAGVTINKVEFYSTSNVVPELIDPLDYSYDPTGNRVILNTIPNTLNQAVANPIIVTYTQNNSPLASYPVIQQAGLMLLTHLYNCRSTVGDTTTMKAEVPFGVSTLDRKSVV